jgi:hypothetical protein
LAFRRWSTPLASRRASADGVTSGFSQLLPAADLGFPATQIILGANFDSIKAFWFVVENAVDRFGKDEFFIDERAPPRVSEPGSLVLLGLGLTRRRKAA